MQCPKCNAQIPENSQFCTNCGAATGASVQNAPLQNVPLRTEPVQEKPVDFKDFLTRFAPEEVRKSLRSASILAYACAGISAVANLVLGYPLGLIDVAILLGLALGMHLGKSKICAILLLIAAVVEVAYTLAITGNFGGWLWILAGVSGVMAFAKADKMYKQYQNGVQ